MLVLRILGVLVVIAIGASILAYLFSRDRRYLSLAWRIIRYALLFLFIFLSLMFLERALGPVTGLL
jgi:nucleoside permease NupC